MTWLLQMDAKKFDRWAAVPGPWFKHRLTRFLRAGYFEQNRCDLIVYDFDGVMTDNRALVTEDGREAVRVHRGDGLGVRLLKGRGMRQLILSTERNPVVEQRAAKLAIELVQGCDDKAGALAELATRAQISLANTVYVGNDVNDLEAMQLVGFPVAPFDAAEPVLRIARYVTRAKGGEGVIRELALVLFAVRW